MSLDRPLAREAVGDVAEADEAQRHQRVDGVQRAVRAAAEVAHAARVAELAARRGRGDDLAGVDAGEDRPRPLERVRDRSREWTTSSPERSSTVRSPSSVQLPPRPSATAPPGAKRRRRPSRRRPRGRPRARPRRRPRGARAGAPRAPRPTRPWPAGRPWRRGSRRRPRGRIGRVGAAAGDEQAQVGEGVADVVVALDRRLAVVGAQDDGVALEEGLGPAGRRHQPGDVGVGPGHGVEGAARSPPRCPAASVSGR